MYIQQLPTTIQLNYVSFYIKTIVHYFADCDAINEFDIYSYDYPYDSDHLGVGYKYQCNFTDGNATTHHVCIPLSQYCDGEEHCPQGVDEPEDCSKSAMIVCPSS